MSTLSLPEEVVLLDQADEDGTTQTASGLDAAVAGGVLLELALAGLLVEERGRLAAVDGPAPEDPVLADALAAVRRAGPESARHWITMLPLHLHPVRHRVAAGLVARGVLDERRSRLLRVRTYPTADPAPERALRERLEAVLVDGAQPDERTLLLVRLLRPVGLVRRAVSAQARAAAERRAGELAGRDAVSGAVAQAVREVDFAVTLAVSTVAVGAALGGDG